MFNTIFSSLISTGTWQCRHYVAHCDSDLDLNTSGLRCRDAVRQTACLTYVVWCGVLEHA